MSATFTRRTALGAALATAVAGGVAGCRFTGGNSENPDGSGGGVLRQTMMPIPHLDPAMTGSVSARGNHLQTGLLEGLVVRDPEDGSKVLPGAAESWDVSDDGLTHTFTIRADAVWSNGDQVTAEDFVWNWKRVLSPETTKGVEYKPSANKVLRSVAGAAAFAGGAETDFNSVGVKATDERTLEITLAEANLLFLQELASWRTLPLHPATVDEYPNDWYLPENWVGNGPFVLTQWQANTGCTLTKSETYWDADSYPLDTWEVAFLDGGDTAQMVRYTADEANIFMIEGDPTAILADTSVADDLRSGSPSQFRCLVLVASQNPILEDVRIRKALSLAIDREAVAQVQAPDKPGGSLVPEGVVGYDEIPQTEFDVEQAKQLLADAGHADGSGIPEINLMTPFNLPWMEAVGGMWQEHLGIKSKIDQVEVGVFRTKRTEVADKNYVGFLQGYFGLTPPTAYQAAAWGIDAIGQFALPGDAAAEYQALAANKDLTPKELAARQQEILDAEMFPEFKKYVDLTAQATEAAADPDEAHRLSLEALKAREESYVAIPVTWAGYAFMVKPSVKGVNITSYPDHVFSLKGVSVEG